MAQRTTPPSETQTKNQRQLIQSSNPFGFDLNFGESRRIAQWVVALLLS
jgi:hypothetical protein